MHRRILGRPTFGRWEIDSYFDVAARHGFYGVVDAMVNSPEYQEAFGLDTVPYERFITPTDVNQRRVPSFATPFEEIVQPDLSLGQRPIARVKDSLRTSADITARNLVNKQTVRGSWNAEVSTNAPDSRWAGLLRTQGTRTPFSVSTPSAPEDPQSTPAQVSWKPAVSAASAAPISRMANALRTSDASGYLKRGGIPAITKLDAKSTESELTAAINATYKQLLNKVPLESERLASAESKLRNRDIDLKGFIEAVAMGEAFQSRLSKMAPLRAASAAGLALLGRATTPEETTSFLQLRATSGQPAAVKALLADRDQSVPRFGGMETTAGTTQATMQRTAALYRGNAGMNPPTTEKI
jgi:phycobilisome core-membrane linker protein